MEDLWNMVKITEDKNNARLKSINFPHAIFTLSKSIQQSYSKGQPLILTGFEAVINLFTAPNKTDAELILYQNTYKRLRIDFPHTMKYLYGDFTTLPYTTAAKRKGVISHEDHMYKIKPVKRCQHCIKSCSVKNDNAYT